MSPTVLRVGAYKFFFYANEGLEPVHIHVWSADGQAKFWLEPVVLAKSRGFNQRQLNQIDTIVREHQTQLAAAWREFFGS